MLKIRNNLDGNIYYNKLTVSSTITINGHFTISVVQQQFV